MSPLLCIFLTIFGTTKVLSQGTDKIACLPPHDHYPFCNITLALDDRVRNLISLIPNNIKPALLTARGPQKNGNRQAIPEIGVPSYYWGSNCIHSSMFSNCTKDGKCSVSFPSGPNQAASFDTDLIQALANVVGIETRAGWNVNWVDNGMNGAGLDCWGPVLNVNRDPRWGRNGEGGTEDPHLMGAIGLAWSRGLQNGVDSNHTLVSITIKHFVGNSVEGLWSTNGTIWGEGQPISRHTIDANISKYSLQDYYWPAFRTSIKDGNALGVMCSYNMVRGTPTCLDPLQKAARDQWGYEGYVTSDSDSIDDAWRSHKYVDTGEKASCQAVSKGGCDIDSGNTYFNYLLKGINESLCTMSDVDERLFNTFRVRFRLGLFDSKSDPYWKYNEDNIGTDQNVQLNLIAAEESIVLLQHGNVHSSSGKKALLPLQPGINIAIVGPHGNAQRAMIQTDTGKICNSGNFDCIESPFTAIQKMNVGGQTTYNQGTPLIENDDSQIQKAVAEANQADVIILAIGITSCGDWWRSKEVPSDLIHCHFNETDGSKYLEAESHDRETIAIPPIQLQLSDAIISLNKPTIIILLHGGQIGIEKFVNVDHVTIVDAFYPGAMGGIALGNLLFGKTNRWGKLPYTSYHSNWTLNHNMLQHDPSADQRTYRYMPEDDSQLILPFGHGLSLTTFKLSFTNPTNIIHLKTDGSSPNVKVNIDVSNVGSIMGDEVVQAYLRPTSVPGIQTTPIKSLFHFERLNNIDAGKTVGVIFELNCPQLLLVTKDGDRVCEPGEYDISFENGAGSVLTLKVMLEGSRNVVEKFPSV